MLNIEVNRSAEGVERYFDRELAVSDYLMKEPGVWAGRGAERLGLRGPVRRSEFVALFGGVTSSVMHPGERKSVWELVQALRRSKPPSRNRMMPDLWATRQAEIGRRMEMER
jgi:hypothetical protein